jgi:hypothetical protein
MRMEEKSARGQSSVVGAGNAARGVRQARVDLEAHGVLPWVFECHFRIDALTDAEIRSLGDCAGHITFWLDIARSDAVSITILHGDAQKR